MYFNVQWWDGRISWIFHIHLYISEQLRSNRSYCHISHQITIECKIMYLLPEPTTEGSSVHSVQI